MPLLLLKTSRRLQLTDPYSPFRGWGAEGGLCCRGFLWGVASVACCGDVCGGHLQENFLLRCLKRRLRCPMVMGGWGSDRSIPDKILF